MIDEDGKRVTTTVTENRLNRILVTGVSGVVGSVVARDLLAHGYTVRGLDKNPPPEDLIGKIESVYVDMTDRMGMMAAVEGCDGIAHLAAIPHPRVPNPEDILPVNVIGTQYLLDAAEKHGVNRVAIASTCCTFGFYFATHLFDPDYLPLDENHPVKPQDLYGLSKVLCEEECAAYTRRTGMTTVALRLTSVMNLERGSHRNWMRHMLTSDERRNDFWTYIDVQDTARAFRLALENAPEGTHANLIIAARDSMTAHDIRDMVRKHFPAVADQIAHLAPGASAYDTSLAEKHIGFVAERSWRDYPAFAELDEVKTGA